MLCVETMQFTSQDSNSDITLARNVAYATVREIDERTRQFFVLSRYRRPIVCMQRRCDLREAALRVIACCRV